MASVAHTQPNIDISTLVAEELRSLIAAATARLQELEAAVQQTGRSEEPAQSEPQRVLILSRYRDLNAKGRGSEVYRLGLLPDRSGLVWVSEHPEAFVVSDNWRPRGVRASERKCSTQVEVPVGMIIVEIEGDVGYGKPTWRYSAGVVHRDENDDNPRGGIVVEKSTVKHLGMRGSEHVLEIEGKRVTVPSPWRG